MPDTPKAGAASGGADFVKNIVKDPANVPDVEVLRGYEAPGSSEPGHDRLYLSTDLSAYVEIPTDAILYRAPVPATQDHLGAVDVWVKKDAALKYKQSPAANALAHYFAGALAGGAVPQPQGVTLAAQCQPTIVAACQPTLGGCPPPPTNLCTHAPLCAPQTQVCTHPPQCYTPPPTPGCTHPPQCHQPTLPPFCPGVTHPPQCLPQTPACVTHNTPCLHTPLVACPPPPTQLCTHPPQCLPQTVLCQTHNTPCLHTPLVGCPPPTPACVTHNTPCLHTLPAVCQVITTNIHACPQQSFPACPPPGASIACGSIACGATLGCGGNPVGGGGIG
jgi:hypothetical protein